MRADSLSTKMSDVRESGGASEKYLLMSVLQTMALMGEVESWCGIARKTEHGYHRSMVILFVFTRLQQEKWKE